MDNLGRQVTLFRSVEIKIISVKGDWYREDVQEGVGRSGYPSFDPNKPIESFTAKIRNFTVFEYGCRQTYSFAFCEDLESSIGRYCDCLIKEARKAQQELANLRTSIKNLSFWDRFEYLITNKIKGQ